MPQLTVLMPVYNAEKYLAEAIDSILQQSFSDFEFIIIDDGSADRSVAIAQSYADSRIRFIQNEKNLGISATLNKGIELAATDYIARMDADDISYPGRLEKQFAYMQAHPDCAMVSSLVNVISENGQLLRKDKFESDYFYYNLTFICWIYHPTVMYLKKAVKEVGMYAVPYAEDFELFWQLTRKFKFYNLPEVLLDYRVTGQSLHQVLKKQEYAEAQRAQLLRNFRYYAGNDYTIPDSYVECLQHNFQPLLSERSVTSALACIKELDKLTACILAKENVNRNPVAIKKAANYKRRFIVSYLSRHLPRSKGLSLLLQAGYPDLLYKIAKRNLMGYIKKTD